MTESISAYSFFKNLSYVATFIASAEWLGLNHEALLVFAALMLIDIATGVIRVAVVDGGKAVLSSALKRGITSKFLVLTAIFSVAITGKGVGFEMDGLIQAAVNVLILGELYSILGNIHSARTGSKKVEFDAVAFILGKVREMLEKVVK